MSSNHFTTLPHGGGIEAAAQAWGCNCIDIIDLSTGLHPHGAPAWLGEWLQAHADLAGRYPDGDGEPARSALAEAFDIAPESLLITAGAQAAIETMFHSMAWPSIAIQVPCYREPIRCALRAGCRVLAYQIEEPIPADVPLWWTSPHNPSGTALPFPTGRTGLLDESYMPFQQRQRYGVIPGVIRLGSLTKNFAIPGLRLGYVIAEAAQIERIKQWQPPWPTSTVAQHLLPALLPEADMRDQQIETARLRLQRLLTAASWRYQPSEGSFLLAQPLRTPMPDFSAARILVRHFPEWPQLAGWVRLGLPGSEVAWQRLEALLGKR